MAKAKTSFTPANAKSIHYMIEGVYEIKDAADADEAIEEAVDKLRERGAAHIVVKTTIAEDFETAARAIEKRGV